MKNKKVRLEYLGKICFLIIVIFITVFPASASGADENPSVYTQNAEHNVTVSMDKGRDFLYASAGSDPIIMTVVSEDGSISVCDATSTTTYVYEYTANLRYIKTMKFTNEYELFGGFTKDREGNYYFFYGKDLEEDEFKAENMALVKYDSSGQKLNIIKINSFDNRIIPSYYPPYFGVRHPFRHGARRLEISGNLLCVYFSRLLFQDADKINHQASFGFIVDKDTFTMAPIYLPFVSHSFNQFVLPVENGFIFVDQGDGKTLGGDRGFDFSQYDRKSDRIIIRPTNMSFSFKLDNFWDDIDEHFYNWTFAQLGGIAKSPGGFIFAGTYEKNGIANTTHNDSRNLFLLTMNGVGIDDKVSPPLWITNYTNKDTENAANPKIVALSDNHFLLMWELFTRNSYKSAYMVIIDGSGKLLTNIIEMPNVRLNTNDVPRYNRSTGNVHWAINNENNKIDIYSFNPASFAKINIPPFTPTVYRETNPFKIPIDSKTPDGGYGLVLSRFAPDKTSAVHDELFDIRCTFDNPTSEVFKWHHFGAGLFDDKGNLVEIIAVYIPTSQMERRESAHFIIKDAKVSNAVKPGNYRLRLLVLPDGRDWRIASVPDRTTPTEIAFTVTTINERTTPAEAAVPIAVTPSGSGVAADSSGLGLEKFTVDKTSVPQNQLFTVQATINNSGSDTFPKGQIGGALVNNNGGIVEVVGVLSFDSLRSGATRANRTVYCAVPSTVQPGQYSLRTVARPTGGEWKVVAISDKGAPNAITITVTAGEATIAGYGLALTDFTVNSRSSAVSVALGEKFSVNAKILKVGPEAFPGGQFGVALVGNNGSIVEVISTRDWNAFSGELSQNLNNISVPGSVAPGKYNLRVVVRPTGGQWRIATMSAGGAPTSIDFTVR